jgi:hypothetical protein
VMLPAYQGVFSKKAVTGTVPSALNTLPSDQYGF